MKNILIINDIRSCHNVGSMLRTADGLGWNTVYMCGHTPYPKHKNDKRLPHVSKRAEKQIDKTALGAQNYINWEYAEDTKSLIEKLKIKKYKVVALEITPKSVDISNFDPPKKLAMIVGNEKEGIPVEVLKLCDEILYIPMQDKKNSFNVSVSAAIAMYKLASSN